MATIRELEARFTATVNGFRNAANQVRSELTNINRDTQRTSQQSSRNFTNITRSLTTLERSLSRTFGEGSEQSREFNEIMERMQREFRETGLVSESSMSDVEVAIERARIELSRTGDTSSATFRRMKSDLTEARREVEELRESLRETNRRMGELGDSGNLDDASKEINNVNESTQSLTDSLVKGASKAVAFVAAIVGVGKVGGMMDEVTESFNSLEAQTGATAEEMESMKGALENIYSRGYGESIQEIADTMAYAKQTTGFFGEELEYLTQDALMLRDTFNMEITESIRGADSLYEQFGLTGSESMAMIAESIQAGLNRNDDLIDTIEEYSVFFKNAGMDANDMFGILQSASQSGVRNLDLVGDAMKEFSIIMKEDGDKATNALNGLGLNSGELRKKFAEGGEGAKEAFQTILGELGKIEDPLKRNRLGVELFGTKFEDLESDAILAMANVDGSIEGSIDTLNELNELRFDSIGGAIKGLSRYITAEFLFPLQDKLMPGINQFISDVKTGFGGLKQLFSGDEAGFAETVTKGFGQENGLKVMKFFFAIQDGFNKAKAAIQPFKEGFEGLFAMFNGDIAEGQSILKRLGLTSEQIEIIKRYIQLIQQAINGFISGAQSAFSNLGNTFRKVWDFLGPYVKPLLQDIANFFFGIVAKITSFWEENGSMIMQAAKNAFGFILSTIKFIMPAVLFIIETVWGNIKGVINGALNIIMGAIKIFAGLFTGNWSKLWEGVKQLLKGALEFAWNLFNLLMLGKLITGIKTLGTRAVAYFKDMWTKVVEIFRNMDNQIVKIASNLVSRVLGFFRNFYNDFRRIFQTARTFGVNTFNALRDGVVGAGRKLVDNVLSGFRSMKNNAVAIFSDLRGRVSSTFNNIVDGAKALPGRIGNGIKSMASKATAGIKSLANKMTQNLALGINGVIGGINWALGKVGVDKKLSQWEPAKYAQGTESHPGGLAVVGDGKKRELVILPDGQMFLSPNTDTMVNLPKGTQVISGPNTEKLVPQYAKGTGIINKAAGAIKKGANVVKDKALDVWEYASNPGKLFTLLLEKFGVKTPNFPGVLQDFGTGAFTKVKDSMKGYLSKMLDKIGGEAPNVSGNASAWKSQIMRAAGAMNEAITGNQLNGIIAQIQRESGGNQRIIQSSAVVDVNTLSGNPARGLLQYIPQTFRAYAVRGYEDIYNGYHQLLAFFNNKNWRRDLPYGKSGWGPSGGRKINGFWQGARVAMKQLAWISEKGAEYIIPTDGGQRAYDLWKQAGVENGFAGSIDNNLNLKADIAVVTNINGKVVARETHKDMTLYQNQSKRQAQSNGKAKVRKS